MRNPNTHNRIRTVAASVAIAGATLLAGAEAAAAGLVDTNGLLRLLDALDAWPF